MPKKQCLAGVKVAVDVCDAGDPDCASRCIKQLEALSATIVARERQASHLVFHNGNPELYRRFKSDPSKRIVNLAWVDFASAIKEKGQESLPAFLVPSPSKFEARPAITEAEHRTKAHPMSTDWTAPKSAKGRSRGQDAGAITPLTATTAQSRVATKETISEEVSDKPLMSEKGNGRRTSLLSSTSPPLELHTVKVGSLAKAGQQHGSHSKVPTRHEKGEAQQATNKIDKRPPKRKRLQTHSDEEGQDLEDGNDDTVAEEPASSHKNKSGPPANRAEKARKRSSSSSKSTCLGSTSDTLVSTCHRALSPELRTPLSEPWTASPRIGSKHQPPKAGESRGTSQGNVGTAKGPNNAGSSIVQGMKVRNSTPKSQSAGAAAEGVMSDNDENVCDAIVGEKQKQGQGKSNAQAAGSVHQGKAGWEVAADTRTRVSSGTKGEGRAMVVATSGLDGPEREWAKHMVMQINKAEKSRRHEGCKEPSVARFSSALNASSPFTHLLTPVDRDVRRTMKVLVGLVNGAYLLSTQWLVDSEKAGRFLFEGPYQIPKWTECQERNVKQLLADQVVFVTPSQDPPRHVLHHLVIAMGANIALTVAEATLLVASESQQIDNRRKRGSSHSHASGTHQHLTQLHKQGQVVRPTFLFDALETGSLPRDRAAYKIDFSILS